MSLLTLKQAVMGSGVPPVSYTTLNPADKSVLVALSGGDLVASALSASAGFARSVKAITAPSYFEGVFTAGSGTGASHAIGVVKSTATLSSSMGYSTADGWSIWGPSEGARSGGVTAFPTPAVIGDVVGVACDPSAGKIWLRINGAAWLGGGNPAAGTSPTFSGLTGTLHAGACPWGAGHVITMRFDPASFSDPAPSGFSPIVA
jgi:hypothetical protein